MIQKGKYLIYGQILSGRVKIDRVIDQETNISHKINRLYTGKEASEFYFSLENDNYNFTLRKIKNVSQDNFRDFRIEFRISKREREKLERNIEKQSKKLNIPLQLDDYIRQTGIYQRLTIKKADTSKYSNL